LRRRLRRDAAGADDVWAARRRLSLYRRLADAEVELKPFWRLPDEGLVGDRTPMRYADANGCASGAIARRREEMAEPMIDLLSGAAS
jgi:hypothetical protein